MAASRVPRIHLFRRAFRKSPLQEHCIAIRTSACILPRQCTRNFNLRTPSIEADSLPPEPLAQTPQHGFDTNPAQRPQQRSKDSHDFEEQQPFHIASQKYPPHSPRYDRSRAPSPAKPPPNSLNLSSSIRESLPYLASQPPWYITIHIHGKPYLVTEGDTLRLPFVMHGVTPGDILRLDRASVIGSRDWTLRSGSAPDSSLSSPSQTKSPDDMLIGRTHDLGSVQSFQNIHQFNTSTSDLLPPRPKKINKPTYLDSRLFLCRATVVGTEQEPLRVKEKTKQRQRHVKHVKSKHAYTVLRITEVRARGLEELEEMENSDKRVTDE